MTDLVIRQKKMPVSTKPPQHTLSHTNATLFFTGTNEKSLMKGYFKKAIGTLLLTNT